MRANCLLLPDLYQPKTVGALGELWLASGDILVILDVVRKATVLA